MAAGVEAAEAEAEAEAAAAAEAAVEAVAVVTMGVATVRRPPGAWPEG